MSMRSYGRNTIDILKKLYAQLNIPVMDLPYGVTLEYRNGMGIVLMAALCRLR